MAVPQSVARFGLPAMPRKDKDFLPAFVLNTILGGGVMSSRLWEEVREKRGLAYSVYTSVTPLKNTSIFSGGVATKNEADRAVARGDPRRDQALRQRGPDREGAGATPRTT